MAKDKTDLFFFSSSFHLVRSETRTNMDKQTGNEMSWGKTNLFANSDPLLDGAIVAHDRATPMEATVASFRPFLADDVITSTAAKRLAIVQFVSRLVATSSGNARIVNIRPLFAEVGRSLVEEQVRVADATSELASFATAASFIAQLRLIDQDGLVETLLEYGSNAPEFRHSFPACLHFTTTGHAVAFTSDFGIGSNHL